MKISTSKLLCTILVTSCSMHGANNSTSDNSPNISTPALPIEKTAFYRDYEVEKAKANLSPIALKLLGALEKKSSKEMREALEAGANICYELPSTKPHSLPTSLVAASIAIANKNIKEEESYSSFVKESEKKFATVGANFVIMAMSDAFKGTFKI